MQGFGYLVSFVHDYLVPFIFAVGLIFFIYGIIQYFIIGPGEEPTREEGRQHFIKAFVWMLAAASLYLVVALILSALAWVAQFGLSGERTPAVQDVPNVPERNY